MLTACVTGATVISVGLLVWSYNNWSNTTFDEDAENAVSNLQNDIIDVTSREGVIKFVAANFLDLIFKLNNDGLISNYGEIFNNDAFFRLVQAVFSDKKTILITMSHLENRAFRGQLLDFFFKLADCKDLNDFNQVDKSPGVLIHLVHSIRYIYNI